MNFFLSVIALVILANYIKNLIDEYELKNLEKLKEENLETSIFLSQWPYVLLALLYFFLEISFLLLTGHSWCNSSGCKLVENLMGKDENKLTILGNLLFFVLLALELLKLEAQKREFIFKLPVFNKYNPIKLLEKVEGAFLLLAAIVEGFFFATQVFILRDICLFCIGAMYIVIANFLVWCLRNKAYKELALGFIGFVTLFYMTAFMTSWLKLNNQKIYVHSLKTSKTCTLNIKNLPCENFIYTGSHKTFYLFASKKCEHCRHVEEFLKENEDKLKANFKICFVDNEENLNFLKSKKIDYVPVLFSSNGTILAKGDKDIISYIKTKLFSKNLKNKEINNTSKNKKNDLKKQEEAINLDILNSQKLPICTFNSSCF